MKPVRLQFETRSASLSERLVGVRGSVAGWCGVVVFAGALASIAATAWQLASTRQEAATVQAELQALGRRQPVAAAVPVKAALGAEERRAWNQVVRQLNTPWTALLGTLEAATPENVALVSIEPDARQSSVRLQAEAKSLDVLLAYAQALRGAGPIGEVSPLKHETNEQDPNRPVRLTLNLRLRDVRADAVAGDVR